MYVIYLVAVIAISAGLGIFGGSVKQADIRSERDRGHIEVALQQQEIAIRALRRQIALSSMTLPGPSPDGSVGYIEVPEMIVEASMSGGYLFRQLSRIFMDSSGNVIALIDTGPAAFDNPNGLGTIESGASGQEGVITGLVNSRFGGTFFYDSPAPASAGPTTGPGDAPDMAELGKFVPEPDSIGKDTLPFFKGLAAVPTDFSGKGYVHIGTISPTFLTPALPE